MTGEMLSRRRGQSSTSIVAVKTSTGTAAVTVNSDGAGRIIVVLRGLTGEVTVTDVLAADPNEVGN